MPVSRRVLQDQRDVLARLDDISNLWVAYHNSGKYPDEYGREFFHAVGHVLKGTTLQDLKLFHVEACSIEEVVSHARTFDAALRAVDPTLAKRKKYAKPAIKLRKKK